MSIHKLTRCPFCFDETLDFTHLVYAKEYVTVECQSCRARGPLETTAEQAAYWWNNPSTDLPYIEVDDGEEEEDELTTT